MVRLYLLIMKKLTIALLLSIFLFGNCDKDNNELGGTYFGYAKAELNGKEVYFNKARAGLLYNLTDSISLIFERYERLILKEALDFQKVHKAVSKQQVYKYDYSFTKIQKLSSGYNTLSDDGDVLCDVYHVFESDSLQNKITITSFDPSSKEIKGKFEGTYVIDKTRIKCVPSAPDTIRVKNGVFHTKLFF